ncbi:MAG: hypothetical protein ABI809_07655 [Caldimonas sp.]
MNTRQWLSVWGLALGAAASPYAAAQTSPNTVAAPRVQQRPGGIVYIISGGAFEEDRATRAGPSADRFAPRQRSRR